MIWGSTVSHSGLSTPKWLKETGDAQIAAREPVSAIAIKADIPVLHADTDFDVLARHTRLRIGEP